MSVLPTSEVPGTDFFHTFVVAVQEHLRMFISGIKGFATVRRNLSTSNRDDTTYIILMTCCVIAPECDLNLQSGLICELNSPPVLRWSNVPIEAFRLEGADLADEGDNSDHVHRLLLLDLVDVFDSHEAEAL